MNGALFAKLSPTCRKIIYSCIFTVQEIHFILLDDILPQIPSVTLAKTVNFYQFLSIMKSSQPFGKAIVFSSFALHTF